MTNEEAILRVLTEMRDQQREQIAWQRKVTEQSIAIQRSAIRMQRVALTVVALVVLLGGLYVWMATARQRQAENEAIEAERAMERARP
jgi:hypothetical protein